VVTLAATHQHASSAAPLLLYSGHNTPGARNYTTCNLDEDVQPDMLLEFKRAFPVWPATGIRGWQPGAQPFQLE
jgi:hypothetical protein